MFRKLLLSSLLLAGISGTAMAENGDSNIEQFMASQPHAAAISNGVPVIVDNREGQPVVEYYGVRSNQSFAAGIPVIVDNQEGQPVIRYERGNQGQSAIADAQNGRSPVQFN
jgi:hypothetical protein